MSNHSKPFEKKASSLKLLHELSLKLLRLSHLEPYSEIYSEFFYQKILQTIQSHFSYYCIQIWILESEESKKTKNLVKNEEGLKNSNPIMILKALTGSYLKNTSIDSFFIKNQGITNIVLNTQKPYYSNSIQKDPLSHSLYSIIGAHSQLCVPILENNKIQGAIVVESNQKNTFQSEDQMILESISAQVAVAIENQKIHYNIKKFYQKSISNEKNRTQSALIKNSHSMGWIGKSPLFLNLLKKVDKIAPTKASVLIQGESGTGKERIAQCLHFKSNRSHAPFVTINCGTLQETLFESEFFGHEKGAFTGAVSQKIGLCETAHHGTLFMDEIGELSLGAQTKLLRFLQEGEFYRIGGKRTIHIDVRIISATNRNLEQEVKEGRFREDLFYRLNTITMRVPSLRERKEDIPWLVEFFLKNTTSTELLGPIKSVDPHVLAVFKEYHWPGNIRELENIVERLKILSEGDEIKLEDLPTPLKSIFPSIKSLEKELPLKDIERSHILKILTRYTGNKTKTAHSLGITLKTLYNKLHRYGILKTASTLE